MEERTGERAHKGESDWTEPLTYRRAAAPGGSRATGSCKEGQGRRARTRENWLPLRDSWPSLGPSLTHPEFSGSLHYSPNLLMYCPRKTRLMGGRNSLPSAAKAIRRIWGFMKSKDDNLFVLISDKMALFNLHLFGGINSEWDRLYGRDGGMLQRIEESRLVDFLEAFEPDDPGALRSMADRLLRPRALETQEGAKMMKLEKVPDVCFPNLGFRFIWEVGSVRKMRDFKVGLKVHIRDKVGEKKSMVVKIEDSPVNGDRMCEIFFNLSEHGRGMRGSRPREASGDAEQQNRRGTEGHVPFCQGVQQVMHRPARSIHLGNL